VRLPAGGAAGYSVVSRQTGSHTECLLLGPKRPTDVKLAPYESGKLPIGPARPRFPIHYYLYAVLFILFDIEVVFLFPWAAVFRDLSPRWAGLVEAGVFVLILVLGLVYVWKKGGLEWD
jgi:NADH-quinone oxidoreductase subunit A